ncbi:MAG: methyltransferase domain-containing protein [Candidatus Brennerbacteria bacterium]|nr:methyltransferase domain-containing protein [Candidatus Brennerbacteria bacterium]
MKIFENKISKAAITQEENYRWWNDNPMRYDWGERIPFPEFSREFFNEIDRRFFLNSKEYLPWKAIPFDRLIDFAALKDKEVLEIGVGNGSHAQLLAAHAKSFTGIDLTEYAVKSTAERFKVFGLPGIIIRMDAERLSFPDNSFDLVWSWGVIHHSSDTKKILKEIRRVLKPGGTASIMVYHRGWWNYYVMGFLRALIFGDLVKGRSLFESIQRFTDGAIARYYRRSDWKELNEPMFSVRDIFILGPKSDFIPLSAGALKDIITKYIPNSLARLLTEKFKMGVFLYSTLQKP